MYGECSSITSSSVITSHNNSCVGRNLCAPSSLIFDCFHIDSSAFESILTVVQLVHRLGHELLMCALFKSINGLSAILFRNFLQRREPRIDQIREYKTRRSRFVVHIKQPHTYTSNIYINNNLTTKVYEHIKRCVTLARFFGAISALVVLF